MAPTLPQRVAAYVRARSLMRPGERVAVAVSGGADSVGLLRILLELRSELGIVLSVAHFHHGIRGVEADADEAFVGELARTHDLEFHLQHGDACRYSQEEKISLETAARTLRHTFFGELLERKTVDVLATGHTLDDQAETVLMKMARGAGTRGIAGIFPEQKLAIGKIVRPLLEVRREQIREYLRALKQTWREDQSNTDVSFTRNRVRARVLPAIREDINPAADLALAHMAEIARAEEDYWQEYVTRVLPLVLVPGEPARGGGRRQTSAQAISLDIQKLQQYGLAVQRRLLLAAAQQLGCHLDFEHVQAILDLLGQRAAKGARNRTVEIASGWQARLLFRELRLERVAALESAHSDYLHSLPVPGEVCLPALGIVIRARICEDNGLAQDAAYNRAHSVCLPELTAPLVVRNWRAGDRFQPLRHASEKRLKELLYPLHLSEEEKRLWPVVAMGERIVWVRGVDSPELRTQGGHTLFIEESTE